MAMAREEKEKAYSGGGGGGGKFRKRPFRSRTQTTPYDRHPTALLNPNTNTNNKGWLSKLVDPAHSLINYTAHSLFSSLFRKRLPPPPSSETKQGVRNNRQEETASKLVANDSPGVQQGPVGRSDAQISCSDGGELTVLEKLLKQKTFTRSEIDHLTALMHSRTVDAPVREEEKGKETVPSEPMLPSGFKEYPKTPALENGIGNGVVTTHITSSFHIEDVASPTELAKSYMGSRPSKVTSSILGVQTPALREDPTVVNSEKNPLKSHIMSIVPRATTRHAAAHENGFVTSRSHGRSAIYNMARTPYARIYPTSTTKGGGHIVEVEPSSSSQSALDHGMLSGSIPGAVKRRSSVLDNDIGSVGPVRRIRQKSSMQKPILLDEVQHSHMKLSKENVDDITPSSNFPPLASKSSEVASKILHQLDKLVSPKEKSSELRLPIVNDDSPTKLSTSMLRGQALRSMETVDSSKLLDNIHGNKLDGPFGNLSPSVQNQKLNSQSDKVENGPLKFGAPSNVLLPLVTTADARTNPRSQVLSSAKCGDSLMIKSVSDPPQNKRAFCMSAHEDCLDLDDDDDAYPNGSVSFSPVENEMTRSTAVIEKTTAGIKAIARENPSPLSVIMPPKSSTIDGEAHVGTAVESRVGEKVDASNSTTSSILDPTLKPVTAAAQTTFGFVKPASPNGSIAKPPLFTFGDKVVSSTELTASDASSKEITKSGPIFGLDKVVSSTGHVAAAPLVDFGSNKNVNKAPPVPFTASSSVSGESTLLKFATSSDSKLGNSISSTTVAGATDSVPKVRESDNGTSETNKDTVSSVRSSELAISSAASTSLLTSSKSIFNFGHNSNQNFGTSFPPVSNTFTSQNIFSSSSAATSSGISATADSTGSSMPTVTPVAVASSNSSFSNPVVASSSSTTSFFKFGSPPLASAGLPVSSSGLEQPETKSRQGAGIGSLSSSTFGSSSVESGIFGSSSVGSGIFGFSSSAMTTVNSQSQSSVIGASSGSVLGTQAAAITSGFAPSTQTQSVSFGSSASSSSFGSTGNTAFSLSSSSFPSSSSAASAAFSSGSSLFPSSSPASNVFSSGTTFGLGTSASSSAVNSVTSNSGTSSTLFGSSWQPSKSSFGSTFSSSSSSGFSLGTSIASVASASSPSIFLSTSSASTPQFSFSSAAASTSTQPAFGNHSPVFAFGSTPVNNGQMSMEDSMAEDTVQGTPPATPIFSQQPAPVQSSFVFGASTPSGASPFQFGGSQQNIAPQNTSPFQASGSLGGSFSLGTGGGDKSGRKIVKVKHKQRKK